VEGPFIVNFRLLIKEADMQEANREILLNEEIQEALRQLRANGLSVVETIRLVIEVKGESLEEAKRIVHFSDAWEDMREVYDDFHRALEERSGTA
jgi:hypothetical protein